MGHVVGTTKDAVNFSLVNNVSGKPSFPKIYSLNLLRLLVGKLFKHPVSAGDCSGRATEKDTGEPGALVMYLELAQTGGCGTARVFREWSM